MPKDALTKGLAGQALTMATLIIMHDRGFLTRDEFVTMMKRVHDALESVGFETGCEFTLRARDLLKLYLADWDR
jgi:hypothetical protein